ncbi:hypothetical protein [Rhodovarius crocodyli]|nr:hypothetical protein [Rhodovarius crocodyli]
MMGAVEAIFKAAFLLALGGGIAMLGCALVWMLCDLRDSDHDPF